MLKQYYTKDNRYRQHNSSAVAKDRNDKEINMVRMWYHEADFTLMYLDHIYPCDFWKDITWWHWQRLISELQKNHKSIINLLIQVFRQIYYQEKSFYEIKNTLQLLKNFIIIFMMVWISKIEKKHVHMKILISIKRSKY